MTKFDSITQHRKGREAARCGDRRDNRRNASWLEGYDHEGSMTDAAESERKAVVAWLRDRGQYHQAKAQQSALNAANYFTELLQAAGFNSAADAIERGDHRGDA